jgi:hypothetical protein
MHYAVDLHSVLDADIAAFLCERLSASTSTHRTENDSKNPTQRCPTSTSITASPEMRNLDVWWTDGRRGGKASLEYIHTTPFIRLLLHHSTQALI